MSDPVQSSDEPKRSLSADRYQLNAIPTYTRPRMGNQWHFGMQAHIGVDADSGMVHTVRGTAANVNDVVEGNRLPHGEETDVFADIGHQGAHKRPDAREGTTWHVAMRPGKRSALDKTKASGQLTEQVEKIKASIRAKVEHPFRPGRHRSENQCELHRVRLPAEVQAQASERQPVRTGGCQMSTGRHTPNGIAPLRRSN
jgi:IS5 family transposase